MEIKTFARVYVNLKLSVNGKFVEIVKILTNSKINFGNKFLLP